MKEWDIAVSVVGVSGTQFYTVDAETRERAIEIAKTGKGFHSEEIEVTEVDWGTAEADEVKA